jgi:hypothetical protein
MLARRGSHLQNPGDALFKVTTAIIKRAIDQLRNIPGYTKPM